MCTKPSTVTFQTDGDLDNSSVAVVAVFLSVGAWAYKMFDPVVWRAEMFSPNKASSFSAPWTNDYAFSAVDGLNHHPPADVYIKKGEQTELQGNRSVGFHFTEPVPTQDPSPKCINMTGDPANIGYGFLFDKGTPDEDMEVLAGLINVADGDSVDVQKWWPFLCVYVIRCDALPIEAGQRLPEGFLDRQNLVYGRDVRDFGGEDMRLSVSWDGNGYVVNDGKPSGSAFFAARSLLKWPTLGRTLEATIYFADAASEGLRHISEELGSRGYVVDITKRGDEALYGTVSLQIPRNKSCDEAKNDLEGVSSGTITSFSGKVLFGMEGTFHAYVDVNPATFAWFDNHVDPLPLALAEESEAEKRLAETKVTGNGIADARVPKRQATLGARRSAQEIFAQ